MVRGHLGIASVVITVTHMVDPGCPWAYCALPAITTLRWRYGDQLRWRVVTIGLSESREQLERRGVTPTRMARSPIRFARFGMPFALGPRARVIATGRACRAIVAARLEGEELAYLALRALHLAWFTSQLLLDEDDAIRTALARDPALDADRIVARLGDRDVEEAYGRDRAEARSAAGSAASMQGKTATRDDVERYTAPSLIFETDGRRLEAGGHQPLAAYDVLVANLDPGLERAPPPESPEPLLARFPHGLTTREVARVLADPNEPPDDGMAAGALLDLAGEGRALRDPLGGDALWRPAA